MAPRIVRKLGCIVTSYALAVAGCASPEDEHFDENEYGQASTIAGPWALPSDVHAIAQTQFVAYDGPPPWDGGIHCSGTFFSGTRKLKEFLEARYPAISSIGGYSCRQNSANSAQTSVHGTGRALDVMIPTIGGAANNTAGDQIGNWLITHAEFIGIQLVIWDRSSWQANRSGEKLHDYTGPIPHVDHLHVELTKEAGEQEATEFFQGTGPGGGIGSTPGDVDGDGKADLVTAHVNGNAYAYAGSPSGAFGGTAVNFAGTLDSALLDGVGHLFVGVADVTGDGLSDLVSVSTNGSAFVWPGHTDRTFSGAIASFSGTMALATATSPGHDPVAVADVNGDGRADLVTVHSSGSVYVYLAAASGNFVGGVASFAGTFDSALRDGVGHWVVGVADVTGDGRADLVTVHSNGNAYVYPGRADGSFGGGIGSFAGTLAMGQFGAAGHQVIGALDVNGDGRADLVTLLNGTAYVYPGIASGAFITGPASFAGTMDSAFGDSAGHELVQMGPVARRRACSNTGCRMP
jgi:hypothetical protein